MGFYQAATASPTVKLTSVGETWTIEPGSMFRFGRHSANDVRLDEPRISRFHAQISWVEGQPIVQDMRSTNGTFVDGQRVERPRPLVDGTTLSIADILHVQVQLEVEQPPALLPDETEDVTLFTEFGRPDLAGPFRSQSTLHRLLLDLEWEQRTGTLYLTLGARSASVTFSMGKVVRARHRNLKGMDALSRILRAGVGSYRFTTQFSPGDSRMGLSLRKFMRQGQWAVTRRHTKSRVQRVVRSERAS